MSVDTIRVGTERSTDSEGKARTSGGVVDVTGVSLRNLQSIVSDREAIHLERQNGRTYVVTDR